MSKPACIAVAHVTVAPLCKAQTLLSGLDVMETFWETVGKNLSPEHYHEVSNKYYACYSEILYLSVGQKISSLLGEFSGNFVIQKSEFLSSLCLH